MVRDGVWRTSTRSGGEGDCVEVAGFAESVGVRDSKDRQGPVLTFTESAWTDFIAATRAQQLDAHR
jgi:F420-0:gamma-glutamyl ligase